MISARCVGLSTVLALGTAAVLLAQGFDEVRASSDRETVNCLVSQVTPEEKMRFAQFSARHDFESVRHAYDSVFPRCALSVDQEERKEILMRNAWRVFSRDADFRRMRSAASFTTASTQE